MKPILAIAAKDIRLLIRDKAGLFWILGFPILIAMFFGSIFGNEGPTAKLAITIVDEDRSARSQAFASDLSNSLKLDSKSLDGAKDLVRKGDRAAYVRIPKGFGKAALIGPGEQPAFEIGQDPKRKAEAGLLQGLITEAWFKRVQAEFGGMGPTMQGPKVVATDVTSDGKGPATAFEVTFPQGILWGLIGVAMAFSVALARERTMGTLQRLRISPVTNAQLLLGKAAGSFLMSTVVIVTLLILGTLVGVRTYANPLGLALAVVCSAICFVGLMMFVNIFGKTEDAVGGAGRAFLLIFSMIGGGMIPVIAMPRWMLSVSQASPVRWAITSLEGAIWRGYSLQEMLFPCAVLIGIGVVGFGIGVWAFSRQEG